MRNIYNCSNCNYRNDCEEYKQAVKDIKINLQDFTEEGCFGHSHFDEKEAKEKGFSLIEKKRMKKCQ